MAPSPIPTGNDGDSLGARRQPISRERRLTAQLREAGLDLSVDVREALVVTDERALHRVQRQLLDVVEREREGPRETPELLRQGHVRHESVVGVHGHAESLLHELTDRMLLERRDRAGVDVARRAELERDALVADIRGERSQLHDGLIDDRHVLDQADPVPDAVRAAVLERLPDRGRTERLAGVDRDREVLAPAELERLDVGFRRMAGFFTGDVEADDALLAVSDRELGHLERVGAVAHRADDLAQRDRVAALGPLEAANDGGEDLLEVHAALGAEDRRVADLRVDDPVARQVLAALVRDALDRVGSLHDRDGVREAAEIERERSARGTRVEPAGELTRIDGRKTRVLLVARELDDRAGAQPTVEVIV